MTFEEKPEGNGSLVDENQLDLSAKHQANGKPAASGRAKLPARQEANAKCGLPSKSLSTYTWQEIQRHNQKTDKWLVINRKVYDVTGWADRHPGGRRVLNHCAGEDATVRSSKSALSLSLSQLLGGWDLDCLSKSISSTRSSSMITHLLPNQFFWISIQQKLKAN